MTLQLSPASIDLTVVLPCFNEQDCVAELTDELIAALDPHCLSYELLFVNDASTDSTADVLWQLQAERPCVRIVTHTINSGESAAQATGFRYARGRTIVTMDSDRQNDPADLPAFFDALERADVVCGVRSRREDDWVRRLSTRLANGFRNRLTGDRIADAGCTYRAFARDVVSELPVFNGMHRFLPTLLRWQGYTVVEIETNHRARTTGSSKYGVGNRLFRGIRDCLAMRWWKQRVVVARRTLVESDALRDLPLTPTARTNTSSTARPADPQVQAR